MPLVVCMLWGTFIEISSQSEWNCGEQDLFSPVSYLMHIRFVVPQISNMLLDARGHLRLTDLGLCKKVGDVSPSDHPEVVLEIGGCTQKKIGFWVVCLSTPYPYYVHQPFLFPPKSPDRSPPPWPILFTKNPTSSALKTMLKVDCCVCNSNYA